LDCWRVRALVSLDISKSHSYGAGIFSSSRAELRQWPMDCPPIDLLILLNPEIAALMRHQF
jgi:hypothetical protein